MSSEQKDKKDAPKQLFVVNTENIWKIATVVLAILVVALLLRGNDGTSAAPTAPTPTNPTPGAPAPTVVEVTLNDGDRIKGDADAPVTIVEYSDFQCPYCQKFYLETLPSIQENYIDTGKVKLVYRHFPLGFHQQAQGAGEASECAGDQGKFWEMHDVLFEKGDGYGNGLHRADFDMYAADLGLDTGAFGECMDSGKYSKKVEDDMATGASQGITGTPGFFVNGKKLVGAQPYAAFAAAIDAALAE